MGMTFQREIIPEDVIVTVNGICIKSMGISKIIRRYCIMWEEQVADRRTLKYANICRAVVGKGVREGN
jgi:hypothetical protein